MAIVGINLGDLATQDRVRENLGSLTNDQLSTILAQKAKTVSRSNSLSIDEMTNNISSTTGINGGIGKYGLSAASLESSGYIKPGTVDRYLDDPAQLENVLRSPSVWTGKDGVSNVNTILGNSSLQTQMQTEILNKSLNDLKSKNIISGLESPSVVAPLTSVTAEFGVDKVENWLGNGLSASESLSLDTIARGAQFSTDFVDTKLTSMFTSGGTLVSKASSAITGALGDSSLATIAGGIGGISELTDAAGNVIGGVGNMSELLGIGGLFNSFGGLFGGDNIGPVTYTPPAVTRTVNRTGIDLSIANLIGNPKVPLPNYTGIVTAEAFQLPALSGAVDNESTSTGQSVEVCSCSDATLIAPTRTECEDAGGVWTCYTVNNRGINIPLISV